MSDSCYHLVHEKDPQSTVERKPSEVFPVNVLSPKAKKTRLDGITEDTIQYVKQFYECDDFSTIAPRCP